MNENNFFRTLWYTLKATASAKLIKRMDEIEIKVMGITVKPALPKEKEDAKKQKITPV